jgi:hypothetical protein
MKPKVDSLPPYRHTAAAGALFDDLATCADATAPRSRCELAPRVFRHTIQSSTTVG